jgi:tetratricopeptide (TPR) repeat protein
VENNVDQNDEAQVEEVAIEMLIAERNMVEEVQIVSTNVAYEEFLKDNNGHFKIVVSEPTAEGESTQDSLLPAELMAKIDATGEFQIEADAKNAHVWNELGNVYFNTGSYEDAVVAYSKSIELDRQFAWPYSNLALVYVQKGRFAEAMLLYQRSIELFANDKDKAISWNRLGNVYRRLNDYDNAIAAYQRADELDTDNTTLSLQSRFSLLGNYQMEKKPSYAA